MISILGENLWDIDIKNVGLSHSHQNVCRVRVLQNQNQFQEREAGKWCKGQTAQKIFVFDEGDVWRHPGHCITGLATYQAARSVGVGNLS